MWGGVLRWGVPRWAAIRAVAGFIDACMIFPGVRMTSKEEKVCDAPRSAGPGTAPAARARAAAGLRRRPAGGGSGRRRAQARLFREQTTTLLTAKEATRVKMVLAQFMKNKSLTSLVEGLEELLNTEEKVGWWRVGGGGGGGRRG